MPDKPEPIMSRVHKCRRLEGKTALVTAGTLGIGRAIVERFLEEGAKVFLCSRKEKNVNATVAELKAKGYSGVGGTTCNVGKNEDLQRYVDEGLKFFGTTTIDILVSNAGVNTSARPTLEMSPVEYDKIFNINVKSYWELTKLVAPLMEKNGGSIVFVSSDGAFKPSPPLGLYAVSKTALVSLGRVLAHDLGPAIRVNTLCPGIIQTRMSELLWKNQDGSHYGFMRRYGHPADIGSAAAFLASEDSCFISGETMVINGGQQNGRL